MASPDKLSIIIQSADYERVHYALVMATSALSIGKTVTLFFTMHGTQALKVNFPDVPDDKNYKENGIATFQQLVQACTEMGAKYMVCELGLRSEKLSRQDLRKDITITEGSAASFLSDASENGAILYI
tara:strand:+ start:226 stop:609 length:384 start_codon:yes stop_codon:yes gene_type:complete